MSKQAKINPQKHRGAQCLGAAELGAKDGARLAKRCPMTLANRIALATKAGESHLRHVKTGRLTPFDVLAYCKGFLGAFTALLFMSGCASSLEPAPLPADCSVQSEKVRLQLCPNWEEAVTCSDVASTNPDPTRCVGYGPQQHSGNAWCCGWLADAKSSTCGWSTASVGFSGDDWDHADSAEGCGYLPVGINPCDTAPTRSWTNDGGAVVAWQRSPGINCAPTLTLKRDAL